MIRLSAWIAVSACVVGCQAKPAAPPAVPATEPSALRTPTPATPQVGTDDVARQTPDDRQKSLETTLAVKSDAAADAASALPPHELPKPPLVSAVEKAIVSMPSKGDDGFRPVPPMNRDAVSILPPPPDTPVTPPPAPAALPSVPDNPPAIADVPPRPAVADDWARTLQHDARQHPRDLSRQFDEQIFRFLKGERVPTSNALDGLFAEDREVLSAILDGLTNFRNHVKQNPNLLIAGKIRPLLDMAVRLQGEADLTVANAAMCRSIVTYGVYEPIAPAQLVAGGDGRAKLLYFEVENTKPKLDPTGRWVTALRIDLVLYDANGNVQWQPPFERPTDVCRNRRRDFFLARVLKLPQKLPVGSYVLKITITDEPNKRVGEASLPIAVVATANPADNIPAAGGPTGPAGPPVPPRSAAPR